MRLRVGSLCSGIGTPELAWGRLGWEPVFFSEVEKFACAVLAARFPGVPNLGDMTKLDGRAWGRKVHVLVAGTPCQAFSVAGLRRSLNDERGNLTLEFVRLCNEIDPAFVVWENVPGVLSTRDNAFGCLLAGLVGADAPLVPCADDGSKRAKRWWKGRVGERRPKWPGAGVAAGPARNVAWRVLDAQYVHLAQRRRRVFVVATRAGAAIHPGAVLLEPEGVPRDTPPGREEGEAVAALTQCGVGTCGADDNQRQAGRLVPIGFYPTNRQPECGNLEDKAPSMKVGRRSPLGVVYQCHGSDVGKMGTLRAGHGDVQSGVPFTVFAHGSCAKQSHAKETDRARVIDSQGGYAPGQGGTVVFDETQITSKENRCHPKPGDPCHPLAGSARPPTIAFTERTRKEGRTLESQNDLAYALTNPGGGGRIDSRQIVDTALCVRRLTPRECERLQGFPDDFTLIEYGRGGGLKRHEVEEMAEYWGVDPKDAKRVAADGPRYRALGNAMALPVVLWIGQRIEKVIAAARGD